MRFSLAAFAALSFGWAFAVQADEVSSSLRFIGGDICHKALDGQHPAFDAPEFREWLASDGTSVARFCGCVATRYATDGDRALLSDIQSELIADESYFALNMTMHANMDQCRTEILETGDVIDGDLVEFDPQSDPDGIGIDHEDVRMCQLVLSGDLPLLAGFNADQTRAHLQSTGQNEGDVCACAAGYIAAQGARLQDSIQSAANPEQIYSGALLSGIEMCAGL